MQITVKTIPHKKHRYDTCGDWWFDKKGDLQIRVSDMGNWKYGLLIAQHEIDEATLCKARGINEKDVTQFDKDFESRREKGNTDEPGDSEYAPYHKEHVFATELEMMRASELGVSWLKYDKAVNEL